MSEDLSNKKCIPCEGGIPAFNPDEIEVYLKKINNGMLNKIKIIIFIW